jgi:ferritin-like metal-binding protein YciE
MELKDLNELYIDELKDLYNAENQILKALPKMIDSASDADLKNALQDHMSQTQGHVTRLEQIFDNLGEKPSGKVCRGMQGVLEEGSEILKETAEGPVKDAGMISAAQRVEHYEMAGYGSVIAFAKLLNDNDAVDLLQETLDEEVAADSKLSKIAESTVNLQAARLETANA